MSAPTEILLVEDNIADQKLYLKGLQNAGWDCKVHIVENGDDALAFLSGAGTYVGSPRPSLIVLDLNIPKKDGREVLAEIKGHPHWKKIPVIVLTTSDSKAEVEHAFELGANGYLTKQPDLDDCYEMIRALTEFWLKWSKLPVLSRN